MVICIRASARQHRFRVLERLQMHSPFPNANANLNAYDRITSSNNTSMISSSNVNARCALPIVSIKVQARKRVYSLQSRVVEGSEYSPTCSLGVHPPYHTCCQVWNKSCKHQTSLRSALRLLDRCSWLAISLQMTTGPHRVSKEV